MEINGTHHHEPLSEERKQWHRTNPTQGNHTIHHLQMLQHQWKIDATHRHNPL